MELFKASRQWATRPDDERFSDLESLYASSKIDKEYSRQAVVPFKGIDVEADGSEVILRGPNSMSRMTHWAFGQLCSKVGAPASYLRTIPASLAVENLKYGLQEVRKEEGSRDLNLLAQVSQSGPGAALIVKSITSNQYSRIWNCEVVERLIDLQEDGWRVPPARPAREGQPGTRPATEADVLRDQGFGLSVKVGDPIAPAGIYGSDHDLFVFMIKEAVTISNGNDQVSRGFFVSNSEVGAAMLKLTTFMYRHVCGNHIVWGAENVQEISIVHRGSARAVWAGHMVAELKKYSDSSVSDEKAKIENARRFKLGDDKDEVLNAIFGKRILSRKVAGEAYEEAEKYSEDGDPRTAWGFANGITRVSQLQGYAEARVQLDQAAGKVLDLSM
jgi:hypothetical protein